MPDEALTPDGEPRGSLEGGEWTVAGNRAVRALLNHVAEELAVEFARLMRASVSTEAESEREGEKK